MIVPFVYSMDRVASVLTVMLQVRAWKVAVSKVMMSLRLVRVVSNARSCAWRLSRYFLCSCVSLRVSRMWVYSSWSACRCFGVLVLGEGAGFGVR